MIISSSANKLELATYNLAFKLCFMAFPKPVISHAGINEMFVFLLREFILNATLIQSLLKQKEKDVFSGVTRYCALLLSTISLTEEKSHRVLPIHEFIAYKENDCFGELTLRMFSFFALFCVCLSLIIL